MTAPAPVRATPGLIADTRVPSNNATPRLSTTRARPRTRRAGMHDSAVRCEGTAEHAAPCGQVTGLRGTQQVQVALGEATLARRPDLRAQPGELGRGAGEGHRPAAPVVRIDPLRGDDLADLDDRRRHRAVQPQCLGG